MPRRLRLRIRVLIHFLARSAVCPQMSCTDCLSNNDIQTPDQVSVPCKLNERQKIQHYRARSTEEKKELEERRMPNHRVFYFARCVCKLRYYNDVIHSFYWKSAI